MTLALTAERSLCGRPWQARSYDQALALAISQRLQLPEIIGRMLASRGVALADAAGFLEPRVGALLPDPSHLLDHDAAVARLADAVEAGEKIGLLGDYDVDGASASALLARYLQSVGTPVAVDIPDRLSEGYGPNPQALTRLAEQGCRLVVTLDCGTTAFDALAFAAGRGQEVIVVDHHAAEPRLPPALAVVNPNRCDQTSPIGDLAAVGVTFVLAVGLNRALRERGWFRTRAEPDLRRWLDLVALGTVCDVVPLTGLNRAFVAQGLKVAAKGGNPGLVALAGLARVQGPPSADHLGFWLGPRINAGGRIGRSSLGAALLAEDAPERVAEVALELDRLNGQRRALERKVLAAAQTQVQPALDADAPLLSASGGDWSPGVVGLVASRLVERWHRPAIVTDFSSGIGKGSGRSVAGFDLGAAVIAARRAGLLLEGGGHPMAAGFTVAADRLPDFAAFVTERVQDALGTVPPVAGALELDGALKVRALSPEFAAALARVAPYGRGNPEPRFMLPAARVWQGRVLGEGHVDCWLADAAGGRVRGIAFRAPDQPLGRALLQAKGAPLHVAGRLRLESWQGQPRLSFQIDDGAHVG